MRNVQSRSAQGRRNIVVGTLVAGLAARVARRLRPGPGAAARAGRTARSSPRPHRPARGRAGPDLRRRRGPDLHADQAGQDGGLRVGHGQAARGAGPRRDKPERKQQAAGLEDLQVDRARPGGNVLYVAIITPTLKGADYTVAKILDRGVPDRSAGDLPAPTATRSRRARTAIESEPGAGFQRRRATRRDPPARRARCASPAPSAAAVALASAGSGAHRRCCHTLHRSERDVRADVEPLRRLVTASPDSLKIR